MTKLGAEAFAFVNVARFAVPLRIGLALSTVPWVQANVVDRFARSRGHDVDPAESEAAAPLAAEWVVAPSPAVEWAAAAPVAAAPAAAVTAAAPAPAAAAGLAQPMSDEEVAKRAWLARAWVPMSAARGSSEGLDGRGVPTVEMVVPIVVPREAEAAPGYRL